VASVGADHRPEQGQQEEIVVGMGVGRGPQPDPDRQRHGREDPALAAEARPASVVLLLVVLIQQVQLLAAGEAERSYRQVNSLAASLARVAMTCSEVLVLRCHATLVPCAAETARDFTGDEECET
jgi:hypothetical protein